MPSQPIQIATSIPGTDRSRCALPIYGEMDDTVMLALLGAPLGVCGGMLSLHFDDDTDPLLLGTSGTAADDPELAATTMHHAGETDTFGSNDHGSVCATLNTRHGDVGVVTIVFPSRQSLSRIVFSGVFRANAVPDRALLTVAIKRIAPLLDPYFSLWQRSRREAGQNRDLRAALDGMELGIIMIDRNGEIGFANAAGTDLLRDGRFLRRRGPTIATPLLAETMRLQGAIALAITANLTGGPGDSGGRDKEAGLLRLTSGRDSLIVTAIPLDQAAAEPGAAAAILVALKPGSGTDSTIAPVCRLYGLSSVETRLACHIVAGRSLQEACEAMRVKEQTARSYLKQIFLKTAVNRQADLVRVLLSNLVRARSASPVPGT